MNNYFTLVTMFYSHVAFYGICWALIRRVTFSIIDAVTDGELRF